MTIDISTVVWIASGIAAIFAAYKILRTPFVKLDEHERRIGSIETSLMERKNTDKLILKSLNAITNHMIDGNGIEKLKEARDELQRGIIEHQK